MKEGVDPPLFTLKSLGLCNCKFQCQLIMTREEGRKERGKRERERPEIGLACLLASSCTVAYEKKTMCEFNSCPWNRNILLIIHHHAPVGWGGRLFADRDSLVSCITFSLSVL